MKFATTPLIRTFFAVGGMAAPDLTRKLTVFMHRPILRARKQAILDASGNALDLGIAELQMW
jgi:hypothetical protein